MSAGLSGLHISPQACRVLTVSSSFSAKKGDLPRVPRLQPIDCRWDRRPSCSQSECADCPVLKLLRPPGFKQRGRHLSVVQTDKIGNTATLEGPRALPRGIP